MNEESDQRLKLTGGRFPSRCELPLQIHRMAFVFKKNGHYFDEFQRMKRRRVGIWLAPHQGFWINQQLPARLPKPHCILGITPTMWKPYLVQDAAFTDRLCRQQNTVAHEALNGKGFLRNRKGRQITRYYPTALQCLPSLSNLKYLVRFAPQKEQCTDHRARVS